MENTLRPANKCQYCKELRPLSTHLYELAEFCSYLDNSVDHVHGEIKRKVNSTVISDWLKLASQLEKVEVNTWKFADGSPFYCEPVADQLDSDSSHFTAYSTALTKFIFVSNALEETYRFVDNLMDAKSTPSLKKFKMASMRVAAIIDSISTQAFPKHFDHLVDNYISVFNRYNKKYPAELGGLKGVSPKASSYTLHLVRNLRNHVAHGVFPLIDNPDYWGEEGERERLIQLLLHSCRLSALFMQILLGKFNDGFQSYEYHQCQDAYGPEFDYFVSNCTIEYIGKLHIEGEFSFSRAFDSNSDNRAG